MATPKKATRRHPKRQPYTMVLFVFLDGDDSRSRLNRIMLIILLLQYHNNTWKPPLPPPVGSSSAAGISVAKSLQTSRSVVLSAPHWIEPTRICDA